MDPLALLQAYVSAHNAGVRTGDYSSLVALLAQNAQMHFEGLPVGPFVGRDEVARAFAKDPPGAELVVLEARSEGDAAVALYGWQGAAAVFAGALTITGAGGKIKQILVRAAGAVTPRGSPAKPPP